MDTVTHGIAGSVLVRTLARRPDARASLLVGMAAAMWPDLDFIFLADRLDYLRNHRGWSHSFVYLPLFALALALVGKLVFRRAPLATLWLFAAAGISSHILFDWITSFGTMFWTPLSRTRYSLDWVFILDPIFTGTVLAGLLASVVFRTRGRAVSAVCAGLLTGYLAFCGFLHHRALAIWKKIDRPAAGAAVAVLPQFLSPFRWLGVSEHPGELHASFFDIGPFAKGLPHPRPPTRWGELFRSLSDFYPPPERAVIQRFPKPPNSPHLEAAESLPDVRTYLAFARFPLATVAPQPAGSTEITWEDLRFLPWFAGPWESDRPGRFRRQPFVYRVRLDALGRCVERAFVASSRFR